MNRLISVKLLHKIANPLSPCWIDSDKRSPITKREINECLMSSTEQWTDTGWFFLTQHCSPEECYRKHVKKIAFFVKHGWSDPIEIDVGVPEFGGYVSHIIYDGNHRLSAAIIRSDKTIRANLGGSISEMKKLRLIKRFSTLKIERSA